MRRSDLSLVRAIVALVGAVALAACGADEQPVTPGPAEATFTATTTTPVSDVAEEDCRPPSRAPIRRGKDVRIAGLDMRARRRPLELAIAREITLTCLRWTDWGRPAARATAISDELDCNPNCATGGVIERRVTVAVSKLERCRGRRFYSRARLDYESQDTESLALSPVVPCR